MRVQYLSDLHFEFHADAGEGFVASLDPTDIDVLVVAGDLTDAAGLDRALDLICRRYRRALIVYVHGNHEFYGSGREEVLAITRRACLRNANLVWLDCDVAEIAGVRFVGAPMWFRTPGAAEPLKRAMNDFRLIRDFEAWVYEENARTLAFLEREVRRSDVVVTHYLPAPVSVAPAYAGSPMNAFFLCDVEPLLVARRPALWIHGHTHDSVDAQVGDTRIVCNPLGYAGREENASFRNDAIVALGQPRRTQS